MAYGLITHVAIAVPDLIRAEAFYTRLFDTAVSFRQAEIDDEWYTLPTNTDWQAAIEHGIAPEMSFIARDDFFLALTATKDDSVEHNPSYHIGLEVDEDEFGRLFDRAQETGCTIRHQGQDDGVHYGLIEDIFGVEWDVTVSWSTEESATPTGPWLTLSGTDD